MEILVFWIVVAIVGGIIASNKGRSGAGWFFLCLVLTPLAILVLWRCRPSSHPSRNRCALSRARARQPKRAHNVLKT